MLERRKPIMEFLLVAIHLIFNVAGLILYKYGTVGSAEFGIKEGILNLNISVISLLGLLCYLISFILYMFVIPKFELSYIVPVVTSISYVACFVLSAVVLHEDVSPTKIIGAAVILAGIIIINLKR